MKTNEIPTRRGFLLGPYRRWQAARRVIKLTGSATDPTKFLERNQNRRDLLKDSMILAGIGTGALGLTAYMKGQFHRWFRNMDNGKTQPKIEPPKDAYIDQWDPKTTPYYMMRNALEVAIDWSKPRPGGTQKDLEKEREQVREILEHPLNKPLLMKELSLRGGTIESLKKMPPDIKRKSMSTYVGFYLTKAIPKFYGIPKHTIDAISRSSGGVGLSDFFFVDDIDSAPETPRKQWFINHAQNFYDPENRTIWMYSGKPYRSVSKFTLRAAHDHGKKLSGMPQTRRSVAERVWTVFKGESNPITEEREDEDRDFERVTDYAALEELKLDKDEAIKIKDELIKLEGEDEVAKILSLLARISPSSKLKDKHNHIYVLCAILVNDPDPGLDKIRPVLREIFENPEKYLVN